VHIQRWTWRRFGLTVVTVAAAGVAAVVTVGLLGSPL
jgi:hypothetical protein